MAKVKITLTVDGDVRRAFKSWCTLHDTSMAAVVERMAADLSGEQAGGREEREQALAWYDRATREVM